MWYIFHYLHNGTPFPTTLYYLFIRMLTLRTISEFTHLVVSLLVRKVSVSNKSSSIIAKLRYQLDNGGPFPIPTDISGHKQASI